MIKFDTFREAYQQISLQLASEELLKDRQKYQELAKKFAFLQKLLALADKYEALIAEEKELEEILSGAGDKELKEMAQEELPKVKEKIPVLTEEIEEYLFEEENDPQRDVIMEIRAAAGGEEAALFAANLFRMYSRYVEKQGWKLEVLSSHLTEIGGTKEIVFSIKGKGAYAHLKFESGVHRVQRVPSTEAGGRIHTSTATVALLIEPKEIELRINPDDLKIETFRASGCGGQHVNVTDSAVRITHLPTHVVVSCQDERSQIKNRAKAMRVLKARLLDKMQRESQEKITEKRKVQIGTGERSEKIRTYNFPERRVTDHRINFTIYKLDAVLEGNLDEVVKKLIHCERQKMYEAKGMA